MPVRLTTGRTGHHNNFPWLELTPPKRKTGEKRKEKTGVLPSPFSCFFLGQKMQRDSERR
jgi:hypothetical protein